MAYTPQNKKQIRTDVIMAWQICLFFVLSALIIVITDFALANG